MSHALHRGRDGLPVENAPLIEFDFQSKPLQQQLLQDLQLHRAHNAHADLLTMGVKFHMELGFFLLQLPELCKTFGEVSSLRQNHPIGEHRGHGRRFLRGRFRAKALTA